MEDLPDLLRVAEALIAEGSPEKRIEAVTKLVIQAFTDEMFVRNEREVLKQQLAREWFGLDDKTSHIRDHKKRHEYAAARLGISTGSFETREAQEIIDFLVAQLLDRYEDVQRRIKKPRAADMEATSRFDQRMAGRRNRWQKQVAALVGLLLLTAGAMWVLISSNDSAPNQPTTTFQNELMEHANFPPLVRGHGAQKMHARGHYGHMPFVAQTGIIIAQPYGEVEIKLFPEPTSCALWYEGTPVGLEFDIGVNATASTIIDVPVGHPLRNYSFTWAIEHGNLTTSDTNILDGVAEPGSLTLTKLDTGYGGLWHGYVSTGNSRSARGKPQYFAGTFAAEWCNLEPFQHSN